ncbi:Xaa-Pro aminopeptidase [Candidatus Albibeggiatoa sp. nov. BB20]|uniref:Xaa-Pro aminopeptidase n=1 Tax=Candidatus Albibeggiatoa sp. nov. BB20 TaxID=3162723 RepID=UPI0033656B35
MDKTEFAQRRQQLKQMMGEGGIAILPTAPERVRNRDVHFFYRPDSDFYYLTGFAEPEALLVFIPNREQGEYLLFCREKDPDKELWNGKRAGLEGACELFGADDAFPITDIDDIIPNLMESCQRIYYPMGSYPEFDHKITDWMNQLRQQARNGLAFPSEMTALDVILHEMRLYKTAGEIEALQKAADIAVMAHERAMQNCRIGMTEYELEADIYHEFIRNGSRSPSYPAIVGSGENSCILHYTENDGLLHDGDLVLIDAGCEYDYYASDITRTFPANGLFSEPQKQIYNIVLDSQLAAIEQAKPNNTWDDVYYATIEVITQGLVDLGLLVGDVNQLIETKAFRQFYMHKAGHWLGMDVHDVGLYKKEDQLIPLQAGMVLTIEPGIYIPQQANVDPKWWNIGIRIEDDVLITKTGCRVLTEKLIKSVDDIERLMNSKK